ncbi:hypothetical protein HMPREF3100_18000 [Enterococcus sp. HMSC29A04]|nr:hypothetical protein HMPREF3001_05660 [Enterococcus sp. HMSC066C04]OFT83497.1 hypothetical protein HMPREF3100_18000 [Enterococcus sp. HMSC29A04]OFU65838.1 hypothetical protein HMPREF3128_06615 [Enterococcus sp. HMSC14A10]
MTFAVEKYKRTVQLNIHIFPRSSPDSFKAFVSSFIIRKKGEGGTFHFFKHFKKLGKTGDWVWFRSEK